MTKQKMLAATLAAVGSLALLAGPVAQAAPGCAQYHWGEFVIMNQNNGYRVEFPGAFGTHIDNAPAMVFNNRHNKARGTSGDATWNFKKALPCAPA